MAMVDWHYPRDAYAAELISAMQSGVLSRGVIYAARRMGKTAFLLRDLAPAGEDAGFRVAYTNLWAQLDAPHLALKEGLDTASKSKAWLQSLGKLGGGIEITGLGKIEAELERAQKPGTAPAETLVAIQAQLQKLASPKKPLLLLIDEVQHLATSEAFKVFAYFLRTQIETLGERLRVIFTGSSRGGLARTFATPDMPFFQSATSLAFPTLDEGFFRHLADCFRAASGRRLTIGDVAALTRLFDDYGRSPFFPVQILRLMILERWPDVESAAARFRADWSSLHRAQPLGLVEQWVMDRIDSGERPYDAQALDALAVQLGKSREGARQSVKRALDDLQAMALILRTGRGQYERG